jgi:hypothetical protein
VKERAREQSPCFEDAQSCGMKKKKYISLKLTSIKLKILKWMFKKSFGTARTGLIRFRIGKLPASQEGFCHIYLAGCLDN